MNMQQTIDMSKEPEARVQFTESVGLVHRAANFAKWKHGFHSLTPEKAFRKYSGLPYYEHPFEVATLVRIVGLEDEVIAGAYLHDTVEDTHTTHEEIAREFGPRVAHYVWETTDQSIKPEFKGLNRMERKALDRLHIAAASMGGKSIKLADLTCNSRDIVPNDAHFAKTYLVEKGLTLPLLRGGNEMLFQMASQTLEWGNRELARIRGKRLAECPNLVERLINGEIG